jgi:hypothetical protein
MMYRHLTLLTAALMIVLATSAALALGMKEVNEAELGKVQPGRSSKASSPALIKAQVLLDRAGFSPGDGRSGGNAKNALAAFAAANHLDAGDRARPELWQALAATSGEPVLTEYTIKAEDVRGPFLDHLPGKMEDMKDLKRLDYTSPREALAEKSI